MLKLFVLISLALTVACDYNIYEILQAIAEEERLGFKKHHINRGRELIGTRIAKKENKMFDEYPEELSIFVYELAVNKHSITDEQILKELREIICFDDDTCIDTGEIGIHPEIVK